MHLRLKCFKRHRAQELTESNCAAGMQRAKLLLQKFPQATDFAFFTDKMVFSVTSPDNRQNEVSGRLRELLKKKHGVFFSAGTARSIYTATCSMAACLLCMCPATF